MDQLATSFMRVTRGIDSASDITTLLTQAQEAQAQNQGINPNDRHRILDFPDPAVQEANVTTATRSTLDKRGLLKRAVEEPRKLSGVELGLLNNCYWMDVRLQERFAQRNAVAGLRGGDGGGGGGGGSEEYYKELTARLEEVRAPLYEMHEAEAFQNAWTETDRRAEEEWVARERGVRERSLQAVMAGNVKPWVKRLWEEIGLEERKRWGYVVYVDPAVKGDGLRYDDYESRIGGALAWALRAVGCGDVLGAKWKMEYVKFWPGDIQHPGGGEDDDDNDDNSRRATTFSKLREHFRTLLDAPNTISDGIQKNIFLVIDKPCIDSTLPPSTGNVDNMWIWAVDPAHTDGTETGNQESKGYGYQGHLRVRLQQLVNNFYNARHFRADDPEYSMERLWDAAQGPGIELMCQLMRERLGCIRAQGMLGLA